MPEPRRTSKSKCQPSRQPVKPDSVLHRMLEMAARRIVERHALKEQPYEESSSGQPQPSSRHSTEYIDGGLREVDGDVPD